jgi:serine/threonine-protein kinase
MRIILTVTAGPHEGRTFHFDGHDTFIVGRSKRAHFRLPVKDRYFSRIHFMVEVNPPHCRLLDLGSRNGTHLNGNRVSTADLQDGDLIKAGRSVLSVRLEEIEPAEAPVPATTPEREPPVGIGRVSLPPGSDAPRPVQGYEIVGELGRGTMGVVYLARRSPDGMPVALKIIVPAVKASRAGVKRFLREANILGELDHPNIVAFREMGESEGRLYFAMEYVAGTDAARLLKAQGPLPVARALGLICQLLQALEYAHSKGFVHRDIKPANLLLQQEGGRDFLKLADFGLARVYHASALSGLTLHGDVGGTVAFMPPEQITNFRHARPPADQYSAAATLYTLLTGSYVYDLPREMEKALLVILQGKPVPIQKRRRGLPSGLPAVIHRALAKEPDKRFRDVKAMHRALLDLCR